MGVIHLKNQNLLSISLFLFKLRGNSFNKPEFKTFLTSYMMQLYPTVTLITVGVIESQKLQNS